MTDRKVDSTSERRRRKVEDVRTRPASCCKERVIVTTSEATSSVDGKASAVSRVSMCTLSTRQRGPTYGTQASFEFVRVLNTDRNVRLDWWSTNLTSLKDQILECVIGLETHQLEVLHRKTATHRFSVLQLPVPPERPLGHPPQPSDHSHSTDHTLSREPSSESPAGLTVAIVGVHG